MLADFQTAGPLVVALVTCRLRFAELIDSPAARAGTVNRRYDVARELTLPSVASWSTFRLAAVPAAVVGVSLAGRDVGDRFSVTVRVPPVGAALIV